MQRIYLNQSLKDIEEKDIDFIVTSSHRLKSGAFKENVQKKKFSKRNGFDLISGKDIPRDKRFYVKDSEGYYYIPEVSGNSSHD